MAAAETFVAGMSVDDFRDDMRTAYAVERCFTVLGEALSHVPIDIQSENPDVPWRDIRGMRNRVAHDYLRTDREMMWQTIREDFSLLRPLLEAVLGRL